MGAGPHFVVACIFGRAPRLEILLSVRCSGSMERAKSSWVRALSACVGLAAMGLLLAWLMGAFRSRIAPSDHAVPAAHGVADSDFVVVEARNEPRSETAVGTIRAVRETTVAARILGRVQSLAIERAGQQVKAGQLLAQLSADDLQAGVDQARAGLAAAETRRDKARLDLDRTTDLAQKGVVAPDRLDTDTAAFRAADAQVEQARQAFLGAESSLAFATITAPMDGIIVDKKVQVGDVLQPGQAICTIYDPTRLQLIAIVREELAGKLQVGQEVEVSLDALGKNCSGTVAEIVPEAQAQSRSFEVKVTGPCQPGIVTGMFGRLRIPLGERSALRIPATAIVRTGQLDFVWAKGKGGQLERRFVRLGDESERGIEALSGIASGERVLAHATKADAAEGR